MTSEKPIIFSAPMVLALLEGRKTQTRRVIVGSTKHKGPYNPAYLEAHRYSKGWASICPYGAVGDELWVRENYKVIAFNGGSETSTESGFDFEEAFCRVKYAADDFEADIAELTITDERNEIEQARKSFTKKGITPCIHMPRWASRIQLRIKSIRIEPLQEIKEPDCLAEGIGSPITRDCKKPCFERLWRSINTKAGTTWDDNPWVWVIEFERVSQ